MYKTNYITCNISLVEPPKNGIIFFHHGRVWPQLLISPLPEAQLKLAGLRVVQKNAATCVRCLAAQLQRVAGPTCRCSGVWPET